MSTKQNKSERARRTTLARRPVFITACVAGLAAALVGCSNYNSNRTSYGSSYTGSLADRSSVKVNPKDTTGRYDAQWYIQRAGEAALPPLWTGEAVQSTADIQALRAGAFAQRIAQEATQREKLAGAESALRSAFTQEQIALATADGLSDAHAAKITELSMKVGADESAFESEARLNDALLHAMVKERNAEFETMRSQAVKEFEQAKAEYARMIAKRQAVESDGAAEIAQMVKIADMTESRAANQIKALRTEASSINKQTKAQVDDLNQQIRTLTEQIAAESMKLRQQAASLEEQANATASELLAQARALEERDVEQEYKLKLKEADLKFKQAKSAYNESNQLASATVEEARAAVERKLADAEQFLLISEADHEQQIAAIQRFREHGLADVFVTRAKADRFEREARAEFVKAQAQALANASREEAAHLNELAEKQYEEIKAQAEADAARIRSEMISKLAQQMKAGSTELPGKNDPVNPGVTVNDAPPQQPQAPAKTAVIEPEHVANFKSALAEVTKIRAQADANERAILATFQERTKKLDAWWQQQQAKHKQQVAEAEAFEQQAISKANAIRSNADRSFRLADAELKRAKSEAEAFRKDIHARITTLRAQAQKTQEQLTAEATRKLAQAESVDKGGAAELRAREAQRNAVRRRGEAQARQLMAEADSIETSQRALVTQMRQEIASASQILQAELARLDQSSESFILIAEATYDEATTIADTFATKTQIASDNLLISNDVQRQIARANVNHMRNVVSAQELAAQADVDRLVARAALDRELAESQDIATRAEIFAQAQITDSCVNTRLAAADAKDEQTRSVFETRIASVQAQRDRAYAQQYMSDAQRQARLAKAQAAVEAYQDMSTSALAMLNEKKQAFENAAKVNWDVRLAMPANNLELLWPTLDPNFAAPGESAPVAHPTFASVDTDFEN